MPEKTDHDALAAKFFSDTPPWEQVKPRSGVNAWHALFHFVDRVRAVQLYGLDLGGYRDAALAESLGPRAEADFLANVLAHRRLQKDLTDELWRLLRNGTIVARGFANTAALDQPRRVISNERWEHLDLDVDKSSATGPSMVVTQILIFPKLGRDGAGDVPASRHAPAALRRWYIDRVANLEKHGRSPSREDDHRDANLAFGHGVSRREVEALRRELAPGAWRRQGRRKSP